MSQFIDTERSEQTAERMSQPIQVFLYGYLNSAAVRQQMILAICELHKETLDSSARFYDKTLGLLVSKKEVRPGEVQVEPFDYRRVIRNAPALILLVTIARKVDARVFHFVTDDIIPDVQILNVYMHCFHAVALKEGESW